ncbi:hypothetical protein SESBI_32808 [Sesbania bispinosa]|nr:hypothetical protein SESBI_32808 [Sesbania bispinosa]
MERLDSNQYQGMVEDQDNTSNAPKAKKSIRITTTDSNLERLIEITKSMSKEMRRDFDKMYGRILDLLDISVKTPVISALAQFWSSDLHCFELPNLDLVPTIEEYTRMTDCPSMIMSECIPTGDDMLMRGKLPNLSACNPDQLKLEKRGAIQGLRKSFLEDHLEALAGRGSWHYFNKTLTLTIYGLVLFPFAPNMVDHAAMDVFAQDFGRIKVKRQEAREWKKELADIQDNKIAWTCPWYSPYEVIFSCGDFANVSLMGPRGCVAYTHPLLSDSSSGPKSNPLKSSWEVSVFSMMHLMARAQIKQLEEVEEAAEWEIDALKRQCKKKDEQIEHLKIQGEDARNDTKNWWGLAKNYHEKNEELSQKVIKRKLKAKRKKQEADEAIEGWRLRTNVQRDKKKEWMKRCDDMADCVNYHSIELARRLGEAEDEIDRNPEIQLPPKTARFMRYCQDLARGFGREPKCLM